MIQELMGVITKQCRNNSWLKVVVFVLFWVKIGGLLFCWFDLAIKVKGYFFIICRLDASERDSFN